MHASSTLISYSSLSSHLAKLNDNVSIQVANRMEESLLENGHHCLYNSLLVSHGNGNLTQQHHDTLGHSKRFTASQDNKQTNKQTNKQANNRKIELDIPLIHQITLLHYSLLGGISSVELVAKGSKEGCHTVSVLNATSLKSSVTRQHYS